MVGHDRMCLRAMHRNSRLGIGKAPKEDIRVYRHAGQWEQCDESIVTSHKNLKVQFKLLALSHTAQRVVLVLTRIVRLDC